MHWIIRFLTTLTLTVAPLLAEEGPDSPTSEVVSADEPALDLETCLDIALDDSPLTRAAQEGINIAEGDVTKAQAAFYPQVEAIAHYSRFQAHSFLPFSPVFDTVPTIIGPTNDWQFGLCGRYLLYDNGRSRALLCAASALRSQAAEEAQKVFQEIMLRVSVAFYSLAAQLELNAVAHLILNRAEENLDLAKERHDVGAISRADVLRLEVEVAESRQGLSKTQSDLQIAKGNLNIAMGLPPYTPLTIAPKQSPPSAITNKDLAIAIDNALESRPELAAARERLRALCLNVAAVKGALGPRLTAEGLYSYRDQSFPPRDAEWLMGICIQWPIALGQAAKAPVNQARSQWSKGQAEYEQLLLQVQQQVWEAHSRLSAAYENIQNTTVRVKQASESLRLITERFRADAATTGNLLDAQAVLARAEAALVDAQWTYRTGEATFLWSQGALEQSLCSDERDVSSCPSPSNGQIHGPY